MILFSAHTMLQSAEGSTSFDISFSIQKGEFVALCGNSGAGKTTVLRILAGLTLASKVKIEIEDELWDDSEKDFHLAVQKRSIGFVFQDYALFPHLTVKENLEFALQKGDDKSIVEELLHMMELETLQNSKPQNLSGGQKQRVALARAIVRKPKILLLDEPLSALDDSMRLKLQDFILKAHQRFNLTTIIVSHSLSEIYKLSDRVILLDKGKIIKEGSAEFVFSEEKISGKFKVTGEIISIKKSDIIYIVSVLSGNHIVKVIATQEEAQSLKVGAKVLIASKAFNPIVLPLQ